MTFSLNQLIMLSLSKTLSTWFLVDQPVLSFLLDYICVRFFTYIIITRCTPKLFFNLNYIGMDTWIHAQTFCMHSVAFFQCQPASVVG
mmetsp:Transcript_9778/g.12211  ORF Transcript_9778/g.12211 Transcript_9778/m.12211 type:complete len:88 (+) Transcript_9778:260-523(+)